MSFASHFVKRILNEGFYSSQFETRQRSFYSSHISVCRLGAAAQPNIWKLFFSLFSLSLSRGIIKSVMTTISITYIRWLVCMCAQVRSRKSKQSQNMCVTQHFVMRCAWLRKLIVFFIRSVFVVFIDLFMAFSHIFFLSSHAKKLLRLKCLNS